MKVIALALAFVAAPALAQITIDKPWARATAPGAKVAAGYLMVKNAGPADRLIGATSPTAERVEMHVTQKDGDVARMREVKAYDVPARGNLELKPGGGHLMFVNVKAAFKEGQKIPVVLKFEKAGEVKTEIVVRPLGAAHDPHKGHH